MAHDQSQDEHDDGEVKTRRNLAEKPQREDPPHDASEHDEDADDESEHDDDDDGDEDARKDQATRKKRRPFVLFVALAVLALLILGAVYYWLSTRTVVDTDDAFTDGYVQNIAPQVAGRVVSLDVVDNQFVKKGQALIHIDPRSFIDDRDQAQAQLDTAKAQFAGQKLASEVAKKNFPAALQVAQANLAAAKASLAQRQEPIMPARRACPSRRRRSRRSTPQPPTSRTPRRRCC